LPDFAPTSDSRAPVCQPFPAAARGDGAFVTGANPFVIARPLLLLLLLGTSFGQGINSLNSKEKAEGWQLLFDGRTLKGWHSSAPPAGRGQARGGAAPKKTPPALPGAMAQTGSNPKPCSTELGKSGAGPTGCSH